MFACRGPWGALSPIPENNAIAVDSQVWITLPAFRSNAAPACLIKYAALTWLGLFYLFVVLAL